MSAATMTKGVFCCLFSRCGAFAYFLGVPLGRQFPAIQGYAVRPSLKKENKIK